MKYQRHTQLNTDILVAGGGPAGVPAALAAARNGCKVILVQDRHVLGGNASSEVRMHMVGADCHGGRGKELELEAREGGIIEEIRLREAVENPQRCGQMLDTILYDLCRREPNLTLMLNTSVQEASVTDNRIASCRAVRLSTEDVFDISAKVFLDCTGDGKLGAEAGAEFRHGREARHEFNESLAEEKADYCTLGSSLLFTARKHDRPMPFKAPPWARRFTKEFFKHRGIHSYEYGCWWVEWGGELDTIRDNERIRDELLGVVLGLWDYVKNSGEHPQSANWALDWFGWLPGKRESRRFLGQYVLAQNDILPAQGLPHHWDDVAFGGWPIDLHPPGGIDRPDLPPFVPTYVPRLYGIPLGCMVSRNISNLMFAGRNFSATHVGFASTRVMATCAVIGQAAGTAAALSVKSESLPAVAAKDKTFVKSVQQTLLRDDCYIPGVVNDDSSDLARLATVTASGHACERSTSQEVLSGVTRVESYREPAPRLHRWISSPDQLLENSPAWLKLSWPQPQMIKEVRLVFDTGLHRQVTLSQSQGTTEKCSRGPQPECVRDYRVLDGKNEVLADVRGNIQRLCVHRFEPRQINSLKIEILAAHNSRQARVMEVRCY